MRIRTRQLVLAGAIGALGLRAAAQEAGPETAPQPPAMPVVAVSAHYQNAVGTSDAASEGTVTAALIASRPALRTGELLEFVPGMIVSQHSGDGKANQYFLRGFNLDHGTDFATFVDGVPVNMRTHAHGQGYSDLNFLIPELVQRIDYRKGPYFAEEGDFASAGAAHIQLADRLAAGIASVTVGGDGYRRGVLADSLAAAGGSLLYGLELNHNDGPWDVPEHVRKYSGVLRYGRGDGDDGFKVTAMAYRNRWNATDQVPLRAVASGQLDRFGSLDPSDGGNTARYSLSFAMRRRNAAGLFEMHAYALQSRLDLLSDFTWLLDHPEQGDQFEQAERRRMAGFDASQAWNLTLGALELRNKAGVQGRYERLAPVGLYDTSAGVRYATVREDRVREASGALYLESAAQWSAAVRSVFGLRYDAYRFRVASSIAGDSGRAQQGIASPKLSLIFGPWNQTEYFVNLGRGFHSNDARGTTQTRLADGESSSPVTPLVASRGAELGVRSELLPGLQSSLALWRLDLDSELVFVGDAGDTEPSRASRRRGIEWSNHYIAAPWLLFDLDLAASRARFAGGDPAGDMIPGAIGKVASFGVTVNGSRWSAAFETRYFGPRPLVEDNSVRSASTLLAYARTGYRLTPRARLTLDVFNLFDRAASDIDYYYASRLPGEPAAGVNDLHFHPVEPRTARLTLVLNF